VKLILASAPTYFVRGHETNPDKCPYI
jgi:hypothetical protein